MIYMVVSLITLLSFNVTPCFAGTQVPQTDTSGFSPIQSYIQQEGNKKGDDKKQNNGDVSINSSNAKSLTIPNNEGKITANAYRSTFGTDSGNTIQWDYQVSAVYEGTLTVEKIRTTWQGSASLRNSANISLGVGGDSVSASSGSTWQSVNTVVKYYENTNGSKTAWYKSNMIVAPKADYRTFTIALVNTAYVKLKGDAMPYQITAST